MCCIQSNLVYPDYFVSLNDVGLARYPDNGIESINSDILSGANANYVNKGDNVHCSRTRLRGRSKGTEENCRLRRTVILSKYNM